MTKFLSCLLLLFCIPVICRAQIAMPTLNQSELNWIGEQIYRNECNSKAECLTTWNEGENFPSLGIGHFIWYQLDQQEVFTETFPDLLMFLQSHGQRLPDWLVQSDLEQPWKDRNSFNADKNNLKLQSLRSFLLNNIPLQTAFIVQRFEKGISSLLQSSSSEERAALELKIENIIAANPSHGIYALIDYIHFKGEGINPSERYANTGWGLLQVLEEMPRDPTNPLQAFVSAADSVLSTRVANAPAARNESRWLAGWQNRLNTYLAPK